MSQILSHHLTLSSRPVFLVSWSLAESSTVEGPQSLGPQSPVQMSQADFCWVMMISGNISRCQGCSGRILRGGDGKPLPPPDDWLCSIKNVLFQNPKSGIFHFSCLLPSSLILHLKQISLFSSWPATSYQQRHSVSSVPYIRTTLLKNLGSNLFPNN